MRFPIVNVTRCPDRGLESLYELKDTKLDLYAWMIVMIGLEQIITLSIIGLRSYKKLTFFTRDTLTFCKLPTALILWWSLFTSASVALVGLTMRGNISVITKTIHVFAEAMFLVTFFTSINLTALSGIILSVILFMLLWVVSIPDCINSVTIAVTFGVVLDFLNFFSYMLLALTQNDNRNLWSFAHGLGWHALYLTLFIAIHSWNIPQWALAMLRLVGAVFNIISVEIFILLLKRILIDTMVPSGWMKLSEWKSYEDASIAWDKEKIISISNDSRPSHNPHQSAYTKGSLYKFWLGYRNTTRKQNNKLVQYFFIYPAKEVEIHNTAGVEHRDVFVYDLSHTRIIRVFIAFTLAFVFCFIL